MMPWIKNKEWSYEVFDSFAVVITWNNVWRWSNKLFSKFSLKTTKLSTLQKLKSNLFYSITLDKKIHIYLRKLSLVWRNTVILAVFLVL